MISPSVGIYAAKYAFEDTSKPIVDQRTTNKGIKIEDTLWIGVNSTILDGVNIEKGSVVDAGSVVTKDIPNFFSSFWYSRKSDQKKRKIKWAGSL